MFIHIKKKYLFTYSLICIAYVCQSQNVQLVNSSELANVLINRAEDPEHADLLVYRSPISITSYENNGVWHFMPEDNEDYNSIKIYYSSYKRYNTVNIYFVKYRYEARWR